MKIRPKCQDCKREIIDDLCIVMDLRDEFNSCICLNCRDRAKHMLRRLPHIQAKTVAMLDDNVQITPVMEVDIISTRFARLLDGKGYCQYRAV